MKKLLFSLIFIALGLQAFSQSKRVYDIENKQFVTFTGVRYQARIQVDQTKSTLKYSLFDKSLKKVVVSKVLTFEELPLGYLKFYESIGVLEDEKAIYFYDFITNKRINKIDGFDRYNEDLGVGKFNPVLTSNGILEIYDQKLNLLKSKKLPIKPGGNEYWILLSEGTNVNTGQIKMLKCISQGSVTAENKYINFVYDVLKDRLIQ